MNLKKIIVVLSLVLILLVGVLLFPFLSSDSNVDNPNPDKTFLLPVTPMIQNDPHYHCRSTTDGMIMRYYDEQFGANYLGNPFDESLLIDYTNTPDPVTFYNSHMFLWGERRGYPLTDQIVHWDNDFFHHQGTIDDITYDMLKTEINQGRPVIITVQGHNSLVVGWCEDLEHDDQQGNNKKYEYPQAMIYDTWNHKPLYVEVDGTQGYYDPGEDYTGDQWEIQIAAFVDFGVDTSKNSYESSNMESYSPIIILVIILISVGIIIARRFII